MKHKMSGVPSDIIPGMWEHVESHVAKALEHCDGELTPDDVLEALCRQAMQLWIAYDPDTKHVFCSMTTEIMQYPKRRIIRLVTIGGDKGTDWKTGGYLEYVMDWAARIGCDGVECMVRPGMRKLLEGIGFEKTYDVVRRKLQPAEQKTDEEPLIVGAVA